MKFLGLPLTDRRLILLMFSAVLAIWLGFFTFSDDLAMRNVIYGGYWAMVVLTALFAWSLWRLAKQDGIDPGQWRTAPKWPAGLILLCGVLLLVHEHYGFKILMDEVMLLGTSMSMHFDKVALVPMRGHDIQGAFQIIGGELDKRPLFQPFLVSLLHDLTGYRPENVFVLNTGLTFGLLALVYGVGKKIAGRAAGVVGVILLTSLPLLAQNATGGGFELLNLVMIMATLRLGIRYAEKRDEPALGAFLLAGILLANTRYESVLFLLPVALLICWVWVKDRRPQLNLLVALAPLLLVPYALHNRVFSARESSWELGSQPGYEHPFALSYLPDNVGHALNFFFDHTGEHSNSLVLAVLGFIALPFFLLWVVKTLREFNRTDPVSVTMAIYSLGFAAHTLLLLCYFWGKFDDPVIRRLSLPLNLFLVLAVVAAGAGFNAGLRFWRGLGCVVVAGLVAFSLPSMARHDYSLDYYVGREMEWRREFISAHPEKDYLLIDNNSIIWLTHLISGTPFTQAQQNREVIRFNLENRIFSAIYVFQRLMVDPDSGRLETEPDETLGPAYQLETVWEKRFTPLTVSRISRVTSIAAGPAPANPPEPVKSLREMTPEEREKVRQEYLDDFIKRLP